ncbi:MAG TPA: hypothetical protein DCS93_02995 [Microscillaceae bacterium]|nr:hypothetical protein [Microscillaceae bacterium]
MKTYLKISLIFSLTYFLTGCGAKQTSETVAQTLVQYYQSNQFQEAFQLFLPQSEAYQVAEVIGKSKSFLKANGVGGEAEYREHIADVLKAKRNSLKIPWKQVKFEKLTIKTTKKHLESLEMLEGLLLLKGKVMFQQPVKLVKFKGRLYLWEVGKLDRHRGKSRSKII